jgi:hypothetical protein
VAVCGKNRINGYSARNYHFMDEESTGGIVILQGITSSWIRNPPKEWLFCQEFLAQG